MSRLRKVISVNTSDIGGGAERVAWELFKGFQRRELESWLLVGDKKSDDPGVMPFFLSPFVEYSPYATPEFQSGLAAKRRDDLAQGFEDFNFPYSKHLASITGSPPDVILCHNLHGGYFDLRVLSGLSHQTHVFLVMHDTWLFTGHCAYTFDCPRWQTGCGACPALDTPPAIVRDATRFNWERKRDIYASSRLHVAAPTEWLLRQARESILAPALLDARILPCPVDLELFRPGERREARASLGLPQDAKILVFAAHGTKSNPFKDCATIERAVRLLAELAPQTQILFLGLGEASPPAQHGRTRLEFLPYQPGDRVARYLQAADLYVHAAKSENFGLITAEAQACGTPVVATAVGGLPEVVLHETTGILVPPADPGAMAAAMLRLFEDPDRRRRLGEQAAEHARRHWSRESIVDAYLQWFRLALGEEPATEAA